MEIHLTLDPHDCVRLYVNARLQAEVSVGVTDTRENLLAQVQAARGLEALLDWLQHLPEALEALTHASDPAHKTAEARHAAFLRGLCAGLQGETQPYPGPAAAWLPGVPPEDSPSYRKGYRLGEALRRVQRLQDAAPQGHGPHPNTPLVKISP